MLTRITHFLGILLLAVAFTACCNCDDDYDTPAYYPAVNHIYGFRTALIDNAGNTANILYRTDTIQDSVLRKAFGIQMFLNGSFYARKKANNRMAPIPFITEAKACHCPGTYFSPSFYGSLKNFKISSLTGFGNQKPAGTDLTDRFRVYKNRSFLEIDQDSMNFDQSSTLLLMEPPLKSDTFRFVIEFDSNDTLHLTDTTRLIYLR